MRFLVLPILAFPLMANEAPPAVSSLDNPAYSDPAREWATIGDAQGQSAATREQASLMDQIRSQRCRDIISKAREDAGLAPLLKREPASPDKPLMVYAVDRREQDCSVMVMKGNPDDIRPLPAPTDGPLLQPVPATDED